MKELSQQGLAKPSLQTAEQSPIARFRGTNLDLLLATAIALGLPIATSQLFTLTGGHAIWGLLLYYGVCCIGIVWWRKGSLCYWKPQRWIGLIVGLILMLVLIALIHIRFWLLFLPTSASLIALPLSLLLTATQIGAYYRAGSMWPTWIIHLFSDLQLVLIAHYAIFPHL